MSVRRSFVSLMALLLCVSGVLVAEEAAKVDFSKIKCPISKKAVSESAVAEYGDAKSKVYFCCDNCVAAFKKDSKKFETKANHQLVLTKQVKQVGCPMSGKEVDASTAIKVADAEVAFCCSNCQAAAKKKSEDEQIAFIFGQKNFKKAFKLVKETEDKVK